MVGVTILSWASTVLQRAVPDEFMEAQTAMPDLGWQELAIILVIVIIIFGAGKLPEIGSAAGKSIKEFKRASESDTPSIPQPQSPQTAAGPVISAGVRADDI
jgi:sec-independent protein translocase protein TatA